MADLRAAVAAGVLASEEAHRALLQATVEVARGIHARAASVFLYDEETDELVFEAVAGEGSTRLSGSASVEHRHCGLGLVTRQALVLDDVGQDPRWGGREIADKTGYVPKGLMAVPLIHEEEGAVGVPVLDRPQESRFSLEEMELGLRKPGGDRARSAPKSRRAKAVLENGTATPRSSRGSRRISTR